MRVRRGWTALEITMGGLFVAMMAIGANITSIAPFMVIGEYRSLYKPFLL